MRKQKHSQSLVLCICVALLPVLITGCVKKKDVYKDGRLVITYWEKWTSFEGEAIQEVVDKFNASQDKYYVDRLPVGDWIRKFLVAAAGGDPPDLMGLDSGFLPSFADKGALMCLDEFVQRDGIRKEDYISIFWDCCSYKGHLYALPTTPLTLGLYWNKGSFKKAGLDPEKPPRTIEELDNMSKKLAIKDKRGKYSQLGFMQPDPGWWNWSWGVWFGGRLWDEEDTITCLDKEWIESFNWIRSYADEYGLDLLQTFRSGFGQFDSPQNPFLSGMLSMQIQGVWMYKFIETHSPDMEWGAAPFPTSDPERYGMSIAWTDNIFIPTGAQHPEGAWEFIKFLQKQENIEILCRGHGKFSPLREVSEKFWDGHPHPYIKLFYEMAKNPNTITMPRTPVWQNYNDELFFAFDQVWLGKDDPKDALAWVHDRIQPKLDRYLEKQRRIGEQR
jgi:ABC-type glycerol-3-phosphate transport system substrate-binding protein